MLRNRRLVIVAIGMAVIIGALGVKLAFSYLLPAQQIIEFVAEQTAKVYNIRLDVWAESPDPNRPGEMIRREKVYYAARPDFLHQEIVGEAESGTILAGSGRRLSVINGQLLAEPPRHEEIFPALLLASSAEALETLLLAEQVDISQVHLSRLQGEIAYVIGGPPEEAEAPQFWCDKDNFWPLRLVGRRSYQGVVDLVDIRYLSYLQVSQGSWLPSIIEFYRQDQLVLRLVVEKIHLNEQLPNALFDLEAFAAKHPPLPLPKKPAEKPAEDLEEMRRYLEKKYE